MSDSPDLLDFAGAAARLGVPVRWMRRAVAERRLPFVKVGRYVRFRPEDLDGYVEQNVVTSRPAESAT
jgi:excisionase family DNA binding protein